MALLTVSGIEKRNRGEYAVKHISFTQQPLQKIAIAGESGSGKSTLLKMIAGLVQPDAGEIFLEKERVVGPYEKLLPGHPAIAYLSQYFELRNNYRVGEELEAKNLLPDLEALALYAVCRVEHLLQRKTDQLSGGEKQRIALAQALTTSPKLLLLDEPFSNLDSVHRSIIKAVIHDIGQKLGITCILVSHDAADVLSWADSILVMKDGRIIQQGDPEEIYRRPVNEYCAGIFGDYNLIDAASEARITLLPGTRLNGKQMLFRPEDVSITKASGDQVNGIVQSALFWGSYYTYEVKVEQSIVKIRSDNRFKVGDQVGISLSPTDTWFV